MPDASTEVELTELDDVRRAKPQQAAGGVQARRIGGPVETGQPVIDGITNKTRPSRAPLESISSGSKSFSRA